MKTKQEPLNIMVDLVIESANDVLNGYQTWEEHNKYLSESGLPFNLEDKIERNNHSSK